MLSSFSPAFAFFSVTASWLCCGNWMAPFLRWKSSDANAFQKKKKSWKDKADNEGEWKRGYQKVPDLKMRRWYPLPTLYNLPLTDQALFNYPIFPWFNQALLVWGVGVWAVRGEEVSYVHLLCDHSRASGRGHRDTSCHLTGVIANNSNKAQQRTPVIPYDRFTDCSYLSWLTLVFRIYLCRQANMCLPFCSRAYLLYIFGLDWFTPPILLHLLHPSILLYHL